MQKNLLRFIIAGGINTIITLMIYYICILFSNEQISYIISWIAGILLVAFFYPTKVFGAKDASLRDSLLIVLTYIISFFAGVLCINYLLYLGISKEIIIVPTILTTTALNFFIGRTLLKSSQER